MLKTSFCSRRDQQMVSVAPSGIHSTRKVRGHWSWMAAGLLGVVILLFVAPAVADSRAVHTGETAQSSYADWMRWVPDSTPLSVLSIPGTHDTMSRHGGPLVKTQSMPLKEQLKAGIRALDIRARHIEDRFAIHHGEVFQNAMFGDVLNICNDFLAENPTETILLWLSNAGVPDPVDNTRLYYETFQWYRDQSGLGGRIATTVGSADYDVPIGEVRGKIVIIQGFYSPSYAPFGLGAGNIPGNGLWDLGGPSGMPAKWEAIVLQALAIDAGQPDRMFENAVNGSSSNGNLWPIDVANGLLGEEGMNYRYLRYLFTGNQRRTTGLLYMDFPGAGLVAAIIAHNMKLATNVSAMASDFTKVVKDIAYSGTGDGHDEAIDRARQIKGFLEHIRPERYWSVLGGRDIWGIAVEPGDLFGQTDEVDGYSHLAISSRTLDAQISNTDILTYLTPGTLTQLNGEVFSRAAGARTLLKARFPQVRWNVAVKRTPFGPDQWAVEISAVASAVIPVVDDGSTYLYTVWATSKTNLPPVAKPGGPYEVNEGELFTLNANQSSDPSGDILQFRWDFNNDGTWDTTYSYSPFVTHTYADNPAPQASLEVFDGVSGVTEKVTVIVRNVTPRVEVPVAIALGSDRTLSRQFTIVDPGADSWLVNVTYGDGSPLSAVNLSGRTLTLNHQYPASGYFEVMLEVRDDDGAHSENRFRVVTGTPALDIQRLDASMVRLSWSNHPAPFRLESSTAQTAFNWQTVPGTPTLLNGRKEINVGSTNAHEMFRLTVP